MYPSDLSEPSLAYSLRGILDLTFSVQRSTFGKAENSSQLTAHLLTQLGWSCSPLGGGLFEPEGKEG